jgi:hypothetical protein
MHFQLDAERGELMFVWSSFRTRRRTVLRTGRTPKRSAAQARHRRPAGADLCVSYNATQSKVGTYVWTSPRRHLSVTAGALCSSGWTGASRPLRIKWDVRWSVTASPSGSAPARCRLAARMGDKAKPPVLRIYRRLCCLCRRDQKRVGTKGFGR